MAALIFGWTHLKSNIYQRGYDDAISEYNVLLLRQKEMYQKELTDRLTNLRQEMVEQQNKELERVASEREVDVQVEKVTEYVDREIFIKAECNTVDDNLVSMFNNSIRRINSKD